MKKGTESRDIVPNLLKSIQKDIQRRTSNSAIIKDTAKRLTEGKASYREAHAYAGEVGDIQSSVLQNHFTEERMPDGKMYYNIAHRVLHSTMRASHELVSEYCARVQEQLNKGAKISLAPQRVAYQEDRVKSIVNELCSKKTLSEVRKTAGDRVADYHLKVVDESVKQNIDLHAKSGLNPKIVRRSTGHCCDWCTSLEGSYSYGEEPSDIYKRHDNCRCTVEYYPTGKKGGQKQNVWSKQVLANLEDETPENDSNLPYRSVLKEWLQEAKGPGRITEQRYWVDEKGETHPADKRHIIFNVRPEERLAADVFANVLGKDVTLLPRVNYPLGVPMPDMLVDGERFDVKQVKGDSASNVYGKINGKKEQATNFIIVNPVGSNLSVDAIKEQTTSLYYSSRFDWVDKVAIIDGSQLVDVFGRK